MLSIKMIEKILFEQKNTQKNWFSWIQISYPDLRNRITSLFSKYFVEKLQDMQQRDAAVILYYYAFTVVTILLHTVFISLRYIQDKGIYHNVKF